MHDGDPASVDVSPFRYATSDHDTSWSVHYSQHDIRACVIQSGNGHQHPNGVTDQPAMS